MIAIFFQTIKNRQKTLLVYCLTAVIFLWLYIAIFPSIQAQSSVLVDLVKVMPEPFLKAFGIEVDLYRNLTLESFLATEYFSFILPLMMIALMVSAASKAIAGEIEKGTIDILLSQPISRFQIFLGKYLAGLFDLGVFLIFSVLATIPLAEIYNIEYKGAAYLKIAFLSLLFSLAVFSFSMLASAIFSEKNKVNFLVVGLMMLMYVINVISSLKESLDYLKYFSFFYYYNPSQVLIHDNIDFSTFWFFGGIIFISTILGVLWFQKRDIAI